MHCSFVAAKANLNTKQWIIANCAGVTPLPAQVVVVMAMLTATVVTAAVASVIAVATVAMSCVMVVTVPTVVASVVDHLTFRLPEVGRRKFAVISSGDQLDSSGIQLAKE